MNTDLLDSAIKTRLKAHFTGKINEARRLYQATETDDYLNGKITAYSEILTELKKCGCQSMNYQDKEGNQKPVTREVLQDYIRTQVVGFDEILDGDRLDDVIYDLCRYLDLKPSEVAADISRIHYHYEVGKDT
ncbi:MAG: hypothetical protein WC911_03635 [Thermoleophilia bacterium]